MLTSATHILKLKCLVHCMIQNNHSINLNPPNAIVFLLTHYFMFANIFVSYNFQRCWLIIETFYCWKRSERYLRLIFGSTLLMKTKWWIAIFFPKEMSYFFVKVYNMKLNNTVSFTIDLWTWESMRGSTWTKGIRSESWEIVLGGWWFRRVRF